MTHPGTARHSTMKEKRKETSTSPSSTPTTLPVQTASRPVAAAPRKPTTKIHAHHNSPPTAAPPPPSPHHTHCPASARTVAQRALPPRARPVTRSDTFEAPLAPPRPSAPPHRCSPPRATPRQAGHRGRAGCAPRRRRRHRDAPPSPTAGKPIGAAVVGVTTIRTIVSRIRRRRGVVGGGCKGGPVLPNLLVPPLDPTRCGPSAKKPASTGGWTVENTGEQTHGRQFLPMKFRPHTHTPTSPGPRRPPLPHRQTVASSQPPSHPTRPFYY